MRAPSAAVIATCLILLVLSAEGQFGSQSGTCFCLGRSFMKRGLPSLPKGTKAVVYQPDNFCSKLEIVLVKAEGEKWKCVRPETKLGKYILSRNHGTEVN